MVEIVARWMKRKVWIMADQKIAWGLRSLLSRYKFHVEVCSEGRSFGKIGGDLIIVQAGDEGRFREIWRKYLKKSGGSQPIFVISKNHCKNFEGSLFQFPIVDFITYPYCPFELVWRVKKVVAGFDLHDCAKSSRKSGVANSENVGKSNIERFISYKDFFKVDRLRSELIISGFSIKITALERCLLLAFVENNGCIKRSDICRCLSESAEVDVDSNYLSVIVSRLRCKVRRITGLTMIRGRYGVGYFLTC